MIHSSVNPNQAYENFRKCFKRVLDRHAPLRYKVIRGNQAPFMSKELSKSVMTRSRLKNRFNRYTSKDNWKAYRLQRSKCVQLRKKAIKSYFSRKTECTALNNKSFWNTVRPFLSRKAHMTTRSLFQRKMASQLRTVVMFPMS